LGTVRKDVGKAQTFRKKRRPS